MEEHASLNWLRNAIRYILEVIAALSILLLTLGLVSASWNFLDKDQLFGNSPWLQSLWGLDQALAIDANLPLVFVFLFAAVKARDWVKTGIYTVIGIMLLFVAATILDMESLRQALNISLDAAASQVRVSMGVLTQVRAIATIGLVAMSGLTWTMLLVKKDKPEPVAADETLPDDVPQANAPLSSVPPAPAPKAANPSGSQRTKVASNGHTPKGNGYQRYLEEITVNPNATAKWLARELGVSQSSIQLYRRQARKDNSNNEHDEPQGPGGLEVFRPTPETANS